MVLLIILLVIVIIFFIITSMIMLNNVRNIKTKISFEEFKKFYDVEPGHWELRDNFVRFYKNKGHHWGDYTNFRFNLIDTWKYSWFKAGVEVNRAIANEMAEKEASNTAYNQMKEVMSKYEEES